MTLCHNNLLGTSVCQPPSWLPLVLMVASHINACGSHEYPVKPELFPQRYMTSDPIELNLSVPEKYHTACQIAKEEMIYHDALRNTANGEAARNASKDWKAARKKANNAQQQGIANKELHPDLARFVPSPHLMPYSLTISINTDVHSHTMWW